MMMTSIWKNGDSIYIFFNEKNIVIYPEEKLGFEQIFGRVHIVPNANAESGHLEGFVKAYKCVSQQENNAILVTPHRFSEFMDALKVLIELDVDGEFKLTQREAANGIKKYLQIAGNSAAENETFKYFVEIETIFDPKKFPADVISKEIMFEIGSSINEYFFHRFLDRYALLKDESVVIRFWQPGFEDEKDNDEKMDIKECGQENSYFNVVLKSHAIQSNLEGKKIRFKSVEASEKKDAYQVTLAKSIFEKLFSLFKHSGTSRLGIDDEQSVDIVHTLDKAKAISVYLEAASCNI